MLFCNRIIITRCITTSLLHFLLVVIFNTRIAYIDNPSSTIFTAAGNDKLELDEFEVPPYYVYPNQPLIIFVLLGISHWY